MTIPYTYLIGWSKHNKWYYGVRWAKNCRPEEMWKKYFTSSIYVKKFSEEFGPPDVIQIRKTFNTAKSARAWEHKVLVRMKVKHDDRWLNANDQQAPDGSEIQSIASKKGADKLRGRTYEEIYGPEKAAELKSLRREAAKKKKGVKHKTPKTEEQRLRYSEASKKKWSDPEYKERLCISAQERWNKAFDENGNRILSEAHKEALSKGREVLANKHSNHE